MGIIMFPAHHAALKGPGQPGPFDWSLNAWRKANGEWRRNDLVLIV